MSKVNRAKLAVNVAKELSSLTTAELSLVFSSLQIQGFRPETFDPWDVENALYDFVALIEDDQLSELHSFFTSDGRGDELPDNRRTNLDSHLRVFISYENSDKKLAASIGKELEKLGIEYFLAHRDIHGGANWRLELTRQLANVSYMICVIGENYQLKPICNQEVGWALSRSLPIIPIAVTEQIKPVEFGLMEQYQFIFHAGNLEITAKRVIENLISITPNKAALADNLVQNFISSTFFDQAKHRWAFLTLCEELSNENIKLLEKSIVDNSQIKGANHGGLPGAVKERIEHWKNSSKGKIDGRR